MHIQSEVVRLGSQKQALILPHLSKIVRLQKLLVHSHVVDALLRKLECCKENGVDDAGARHGDTETSVHAWVHELDFRPCCLTAAAGEAIALVDALRRVYREDLFRNQLL